MKQAVLNSAGTGTSGTEAPEAEDSQEPGEQPENTPADMTEDMQEGESEVEPLDNLTPELDEDDQMLIKALQERGYTTEQIATAIAMLKDGATDEEVLSALLGE